MLEWQRLLIHFQCHLSIRNVRFCMGHLSRDGKQVVRLVVVKLLVVEFDLIKGEGGLIVVHVLFDLVPIAVAPYTKCGG